MNGAESLVRTLVGSGVDVCFANPGTSEMHFVAALDEVPEMRAVLGLFEGVVTGAADGYGRMRGSPAATLLHLGPGLANGIANLHNARRARTPVVNIVGDHATSHRALDAPLQSDIESLARPVSRWYRETETAGQLAADGADAVAAAIGPPGGVATLVVPADVSWAVAGDPAPARPATAPASVTGDAVERAAKALRSGEPAALLIGGTATRARGLAAATRSAAATGATLLCETFPAVLERGAGLPPIERLGYFPEMAARQLSGLRHLVLAGAASPVSFFAYEGVPGDLVPDGCQVHGLAGAGDDVPGALEELAEALGASGDEVRLQPGERPSRPAGRLDAVAAGAAIGALLAEGTIVCDEANTSGFFVHGATAGAPRHHWLCLTGGAIGQGLPLATGAAVACPDQKVLCLEADGSAMYTFQSLWTQAREGLDVTTVIFNNRSYAILGIELERTGVRAPHPRASDLFDLARPPLDFVALAEAMGVGASRATTAAEFTVALERALATPGPSLIEAVIDSGL